MFDYQSHFENAVDVLRQSGATVSLPTWSDRWDASRMRFCAGAKRPTKS